MKHPITLCLLGAGMALLTASACAADNDAICQAASDRLLTHLDQADYAAATADFDASMKAGLSADKLGMLWNNLQQHFGSRGPHEAAQIQHQDNMTVIITPLHYGQNLVDAQVACSTDGKISGFYVQPHDDGSQSAAPAPEAQPADDQ